MRIRTSPNAGSHPHLTPSGSRAGAAVARAPLGRRATIHPPPLAPVAALATWMASAVSRAEERGHLAEMDHRMLRDIGISPFERHLETRKWWWQR